MIPKSPLIEGWSGWQTPLGWGAFLLALVVVTTFVHWAAAYDENVGWLLAVAIVIGAWLIGTGNAPGRNVA